MRTGSDAHHPPWGARATKLAFLTIILLAMLLRYPRFPNEFAGDTLSLEWSAGGIVEDGTIHSIMSPLSWFGLYPVSYPQGVPLLEAHVAYLAGIPVEEAVYLTAMATTVFGCFAFATLAHFLTKKMSVAILAALTLALAGDHISQSIQGLSGRAVVETLSPMVLLCLLACIAPDLRGPKAARWPFFAMLIALNFAALAFHRTGLLLIVVEISTAFAYLGVVTLTRILRLLVVKKDTSRLAFVGLSGAGLALGLWLFSPTSRIGPSFLSSFLSPASTQAAVIGYILQLGWIVGPLLPLAFFALPSLFLGTSSLVKGYAAAIVPFCFLFFFIDPTFAGVAFAAPIATLVGQGGIPLKKMAGSVWRTPRILGRALVVGLILFVLAFQVVYYEGTQVANKNADGTSYYVDQASVEAGIYVRHGTGSRSFVTPDLTDSRRVALGGQVATISSELMLFEAFPELREKVTITSIAPNGIDSVPALVDFMSRLATTRTLADASDWIVAGGPYGDGNHWGRVVTLDGSAGAILLAYHTTQVLLNNNRANSFPLSGVARSTYYVEYSNALESLFSVQVHNGCIIGTRGCA